MGPKRASEREASATKRRKQSSLEAAEPFCRQESIPYEFTSASTSAAARAYVEKLLARRCSSANAEHVLGGAQVVQLTEDGASWVYHAPGWYKRAFEALDGTPRAYREWFAELWDLHPKHHDSIKMFGKEVLMPRFQQVYGQSYRFSGRLFEAKPFPDLLAKALEGMQQLVVNPTTGETYAKAGLVNWYEHGDHYMGPHTDDESNIHRNSPVFTLSLGATRRFVFTSRPNSTNAGGVARKEILLHDGDLLIMGGTTQKTHKHALPKMKQCRDKRISITLRCFK